MKSNLTIDELAKLYGIKKKSTIPREQIQEIEEYYDYRIQQLEKEIAMLEHQKQEKIRKLKEDM